MSRTPYAALLSLLACASVAIVPAGCGASRSSARPDGAHPSAPVRIRFVTYPPSAPAQNLALVNPAHTDRTELYSTTRKLEDAGTKVSTDEVLDETLRYFEERGFFAKAKAGPAPAQGGGASTQALEVETPSRHVHMLLQRGLPDAERKVFRECAQAFVDVYNDTIQLQSVDRAPDWEAHSPKTKKPEPVIQPRGP